VKFTTLWRHKLVA